MTQYGVRSHTDNRSKSIEIAIAIADKLVKFSSRTRIREELTAIPLKRENLRVQSIEIVVEDNRNMIAEVSLQPSLVELARTGNFHAIAYWLNSHLIPEGIYARVGAASAGCVRIQVEVPPLPMDALWQKRLVRAICHHVWKLNSDAIRGVHIIAHFAGQTEILWKQSVRIVTPNQRRREHRSSLNAFHSVKRWLARSYKALRMLLLAGTAAAAFSFGCWMSYQDLPPLLPKLPQIASTEAIAPPTKSLDRIQAALEEIEIDRHAPQHPGDAAVRLTFGGDVDLSHFDPDDPGILTDLEGFQNADVATINLNLPLTNADTPRPKADNRKAAPEAVEALRQAGIDVVNLANDRVMDYHILGLDDTLKTLDAADIHHIGAGRTLTEARRPKILEIEGQRIAYFGYSIGDLYTASSGRPGTNSGEETHIARDIQAVRDEVDWVVVNFHWGAELASYPASWQIELARFAIDNGADLIVGHHPRVLQGAELYRDRPIVYALGDLTSGEGTAAALLDVSLTKDKMTVELLPVETYGDRPYLARGDRHREILERLEVVSSPFDRPLTQPVTLNKRRSASPEPAFDPETPLPKPSWPFDRSLPDLPSADTNETFNTDDSFIEDPFVAPAGEPSEDASPAATTPHESLLEFGKTLMRGSAVEAIEFSKPESNPSDEVEAFESREEFGEFQETEEFSEPEWEDADRFETLEDVENFEETDEVSEPVGWQRPTLPFEVAATPKQISKRSRHADIELPAIRVPFRAPLPTSQFPTVS
ncbi:Capsule biosynthesis protein capA [Geitlerinema sp. FC II]|nr:Capsule biosynthesis protein capA [Geitlerinema sp. FC II]